MSRRWSLLPPLLVLAILSACAAPQKPEPAPQPAKAKTQPLPSLLSSVSQPTTAAQRPEDEAGPPGVESAKAARKASPTKATCGGQPLRVHFYNVGQALSALVDFPDGTHWLVDAGTGATGAREHLTNSLRTDLAGNPIAVMWITHQHADHMNAAAAVMNQFPVNVYVDNGFPSAARSAAQTRHILHAPTDALSMPAAPVKVTPFLVASKPKSCPRNQNNCSIGLRIEYCSSSILFVGDAEQEEEALLPHDQTATLLQVGHHGSPTSSSPAFIDKVAPKYAVISAGKPRQGTNRTYCHPNASTVTTLDTPLGGTGSQDLEVFAGAKCKGSTAKDWRKVKVPDHLWATPRDGDVVLTTTGDGEFRRE